MKIYTKTGDKGQTGLVDNSRVSKTDVRIWVLGTLDEANAYLGLVAVHLSGDKGLRQLVIDAQAMLFNCGAFVADPREKSPLRDQLPTSDFVKRYEDSIDAMTKELPLLTHFILPGGTEGAVRAHIARAVVRRAERMLVELEEMSIEVPAEMAQFINRLSDWLFTVARKLNLEAGVVEQEWYKEAK